MLSIFAKVLAQPHPA